MENYTCYYLNIRLNLRRQCESGKSQSQRKIVALCCTALSSEDDHCVGNSDMGESEIPSPLALQELNNTSVCMYCCDGFCYLPLESHPNCNEDFHGYITSAVSSCMVTLLFVLFGVLIYRLVKRRRRRRFRTRYRERHVYDSVQQPCASVPPITAQRNNISLEMDNIPRNQEMGPMSRSSPLKRQTASEICNTCGKGCSSRRPSDRRTSMSSLEIDSDSAQSFPHRASGRSINRPVQDPEAILTQLDRLENGPSTAPPLPPRRRSSASSKVGSVTRDKLDSERPDTEPCIVLLGLEPAFHISRRKREIENSHRKNRMRHTSGSSSWKTSLLSVSPPSQRSSSMF